MAYFTINSDEEMKIKGKIQLYSVCFSLLSKSYLLTTPEIPATMF
jgi:hypothetical protein